MNLEINQKSFPQLETRNLILREMGPADAEAVFQIFANAEVTRYYDLAALTDIEQASQLIARQADRFAQKAGLRWGITQKDNDTVIGTCGYMFHEPSFRAELGYDLARPYWGRGIMTKALQAIIRFGFEELGVNRFQALVMPGNTASVRLLQNLGFQEEGVLREYAYFKEGFHDLHCFSLLKKEFN
jgi:[ribosomal protein S5]-alanine N-acetyltransferase